VVRVHPAVPAISTAYLIILVLAAGRHPAMWKLCRSPMPFSQPANQLKVGAIERAVTSSCGST
jgi:hypothetical protein